MVRTKLFFDNCLFDFHRPQCGAGVYCAQLVPLAVMMCSFYNNVHNVTGEFWYFPTKQPNWSSSLLMPSQCFVRTSDPHWMRLAVVCVSLTATSIAVHLTYIESAKAENTTTSDGGNASLVMPFATWILTLVPLIGSLASHGVIFGGCFFHLAVHKYKVAPLPFLCSG